jgi:hypothetical protein
LNIPKFRTYFLIEVKYFLQNKKITQMVNLFCTI